MKTKRLPVIALLLLTIASCKKDAVITGDTKLSASISVQDAAAMVSTSLASNSNGVASLTYDVSVKSQYILDTHLACGDVITDTVTHSSITGASTTYGYGLGYTYTLNCNTNNLPDNITGKLNYSGSFDGPRFSSANIGTSTFKVTDLPAASADYMINGSYYRTGSFASKTDTTNHGSSNTSIVLKDIKVTRSGRIIQSGTATFTITGTVPKKAAFNYTGSIVFNGDGTAKLTLNGSVFVVALATGESNKAS